VQYTAVSVQRVKGANACQQIHDIGLPLVRVVIETTGLPGLSREMTSIWMYATQRPDERDRVQIYTNRHGPKGKP